MKSIVLVIFAVLAICCVENNTMDEKIANLIVKCKGAPASPQEIEEVSHIWHGAQAYWDKFPGARDAFFKENLVTIQLNIASGGPAGGQTFEKFSKQVLRAIS